MEINLDRKLADKVFPAIDITRSGTRKRELLWMMKLQVCETKEDNP